MRSYPLVAFCLLFIVGGCGGGDGGDDDPIFTTCDVSVNEPALTISSVQNSVTQASVPVVMLSNITVNGFPVHLNSLSRFAFNVRTVGSSLECTAPCGFAETEGNYSFDMSAAGYATRTAAATGVYASRTSGGCTLLLYGGARVTLTLAPA